jgi:hypothetical protein
MRSPPPRQREELRTWSCGGSIVIGGAFDAAVGTGAGELVIGIAQGGFVMGVILTGGASENERAEE